MAQKPRSKEELGNVRLKKMELLKIFEYCGDLMEEMEIMV